MTDKGTTAPHASTRAPASPSFTKLFEPTRLRGFELKNRVKYAACSVSNFNDRQGYLTDREFGRMQVIAQTGCGIITNQGAYPDPRGEGKAYFKQLSIAEDKYIPGLRRVADLVHEHDAVAIQQILHGGRYGGIDLDYCLQPSAVPQTLKHFRPPREMTVAEICQCVKEHGQAARRAVEANYDGVEVTSFMGYLLSNFNSRFTNQRTDEYGGDLEGRARFMVETIGECRDAMGQDKLFFIRLNGVELMDEYAANTPEECLEMMRVAERAGVDCISFVIGWHESRTGALGRDLPSDKWLYLAENAKQHLKVPIAFGPKLREPVLAEQALQAGKFDLWEVCRPFLADPQLLHKVRENRLPEIKPCLGGLMCLARMFANLPYICTCNPQLGHELEYVVQEALIKKRVAVFGAGPAGLEAAIAAAQRGHTVQVYEKEDQLGGQLHLAAREIEGGRSFLELIRYYEAMVKKLNLKVHYNTALGPRDLRGIEADVAIVATGAYLPADHPLLGRPNVFNAKEVLEGKVTLGERVAVLGGQRAGLVTAERLALEGKQVVVVEPGKRIAEDVIATFKWRHYAWLKQYGIKVFKMSAVSVDERGAIRIEGQDMEVDSLVVALPRRSHNELIREDFAFDELYTVGDAVMPRSLANAIHEGFKLGLRL